MQQQLASMKLIMCLFSGASRHKFLVSLHVYVCVFLCVLLKLGDCVSLALSLSIIRDELLCEVRSLPCSQLPLLMCATNFVFLKINFNYISEVKWFSKDVGGKRDSEFLRV